MATLWTGTTVPGGVLTRRTGAQPAGGTAMPGTFSATNNLINAQITPQNSAMTNWAQGNAVSAGNQYANFGFTPYQQLAPVNLSASRNLATGANSAMQGLGYNFGGANAQYGSAQQQQAAGAAQAGRALQGLQGLGIGAFSGGGANLADFSRAETMLQNAVAGDLGKNFNYQNDTAAARAFVVPALERAMNAPDRNALAAESLALMEERSQRGFDDAMRSTADQQAAMGRRGSGMTAKALNDVTNRREQELAWARRDLANEAAALSLQDNMDRTQLAMGTTAGLGAEDRDLYGVRQRAAEIELGASGQLANNAQFNASQGEAAAQRAARGAQFGADFQRGLARDMYDMSMDGANMALGIGDRFGTQERDRVGLGERQAGFQRGIGQDLADYTGTEWTSARDERNSARADEYNQGNFARSRFQDFYGALNQERGNDRANRNELRDERGYQYGLSRDAIDDEFRRMDFEENLRGNRFSRGLQTANTGFGAPSPAGAYGAAGAQAQGNAGDNYAAVAQLLAMLGNRSTSRGGAGAAPSTATGR